MAGQVNWYGDDVRLELAEATEEILRRVAFQIEGLAKTNIVSNDQVDTGFMLNSVYTVTGEGSSYTQARAAAEARNPDAEMAPERGLTEEASAAVAVGASYAVYQEIDRPYLFPALEAVSREMGGIVRNVARERGLEQ